MSGEAKCPAAAPAEAADEELTARSRQFQPVVCRRVQVRSNLIRVEFAYGFPDRVFREGIRAAAVCSHAGEQVGRDGDVARGSDVVGQILHSIRHAKYFVGTQQSWRGALRMSI